MRQQGTLHTVEEELGAAELPNESRNRIPSALDALHGRAGTGEGDVEQLTTAERDAVAS